MRSEDEPRGRLAMLGPLALVAVGGLLLHILPRDVLTGLVTWAVASFPVGVLVGHCVLSEELGSCVLSED